MRIPKPEELVLLPIQSLRAKLVRIMRSELNRALGTAPDYQNAMSLIRGLSKLRLISEIIYFRTRKVRHHELQKKIIMLSFTEVAATLPDPLLWEADGMNEGPMTVHVEIPVGPNYRPSQHIVGSQE